jgi:hypothetical protein
MAPGRGSALTCINSRNLRLQAQGAKLKFMQARLLDNATV